MDELNQHKRIDDFLMDHLDTKDRNAFLKQLEQDVKLQEEVELRRIILDQIDTAGDIRIKDRILKIQEEIEGKNKPEKKGNRRVLIIAIASAAAVLLFFLFNQLFNQPPSAAQLFADYYQTQDLNFGIRNSNPDDQQVIEAGALYKQKKYPEAISAFQKLTIQGVKDDRINLGLAISYLETKQTDKALNLLKKLASFSKNVLEDETKWYLALTYLKTNSIAESEALLKELSADPDASFKDEASSLLQKIKSLQ